MPPKPKYTKNEIIDAAYSIMEQRGFDAIAAREVGKVLGTTTSPIFTSFPTMDELKNEVLERAKQNCASYLEESVRYFPAFKEFGLRWIRFAKEKPRVYETVFLRRSSDFESGTLSHLSFIAVIQPMQQQIRQSFSLTEEQAGTLMTDMCIHAQGISSIIVHGAADFSQEELSDSFSRLFMANIARFKIESGNLNMDQMKIWLGRGGRLPERIEKHD